MKDLLYDLAKHQFEETSARLIVIHPNYQYQRYLLWDVTEAASTLYVRFLGDDLTYEDARNQYDAAIADQKNDDTTFRSIILDECDRLHDDAMDAFIDEIMQEVQQTDTPRVFIISRVVPRFVWKQLDYRSLISMIPVDNELMLCDYLREENAPALLEVHAFGQGRVLLNGTEITQWDGHLPRALFFYIVDRGMTTRNDIFQIFWPKLPVREATNVFHVTKRKINEVIGVDLTAYWSGFYRISPKIELNYDALQFSRMVQDSSVEPNESARHLLDRAISLYQGEFLTSLDHTWVEQRRGALLQTYGEALVARARISQDHGEAQRALGLYLRSALTNPQREDLVEHIMKLYDELEMYEDALTVYERLAHELQQTLNVEPAPQVQELAKAIRRKAS